MYLKPHKNIKIPIHKAKYKTIFFTDFRTIEYLIKWILNNRVQRHDYRQYPCKVIHINFSRCRFLKPYHIAPLACLIHEYQEKGFKIKLIMIPQAIQEYFNSFNFNQFCNKEHRNTFPTPSDQKTLPLWRIEQGALSIYTDRAQRYFEDNHFDGKSLFSLSISLAELINNVFDHSESVIPGYTFTQYNTRLNQIITCVCDFGIGIPKKVNNYLKATNQEKITSIEALMRAFEYSFSTQSMPHNRGFGWDNIFSNIRELNSKILIVSNNALYRDLPNNTCHRFELAENFPGTLVVIWLDTNFLPVKEEELTDELSIL